MKSPTSAVIIEGYNRGDENKANREGSDTNCEGISTLTDGDSDVRREDRGEDRSSDESKGRGNFHSEN